MLLNTSVSHFVNDTTISYLKFLRRNMPYRKATRCGWHKLSKQQLSYLSLYAPIGAHLTLSMHMCSIVYRFAFVNANPIIGVLTFSLRLLYKPILKLCLLRYSQPLASGSCFMLCHHCTALHTCHYVFWSVVSVLLMKATQLLQALYPRYDNKHIFHACAITSLIPRQDFVTCCLLS